MEDSYHLGHRAYIYARGSLLHREGGVKKFSKLHLAPGPPLYPQCFLSLRRVKYRYYVFIIIRSSPGSREPGSPRLASPGGGIINLSLQVPPRIYIHARTTPSRLLAFSARLFAPEIQIAALKLDSANSTLFRSSHSRPIDREK